MARFEANVSFEFDRPDERGIEAVRSKLRIAIGLAEPKSQITNLEIKRVKR